MVATQNDSDESNSNQDTHEIANLYLMAYKNDVTSEFTNEFTFGKRHEIFYDLLDDLKKQGLKNKELKIKN